MQVTATEAKNRFGQLLDAAQAGPVIIEKSGRKHSVLLSMQEYETLKREHTSDEDSDIRNAINPGKAFYAKYKDWVDWNNALTEQHGVFGEEYRVW
jgi:prevent-host-death family protein